MAAVETRVGEAMNRIDRLMATILLLQSRRVITAEDIATHFEISLRTVYRDMAALSEGGVPVVAEAGVGYSLLNGYSVPPVMFTPEEANALFLGGELVEHLTDYSLQSQMRSALLKIRAVLPRSHQDQIDHLKRSTALLIGNAPESQNRHAVLTHLQQALAQRCVVEATYATGGEMPAKRRELEPLGLVYYADHWHLIAFCRLRRDYRDFRTDRILSIRVLPERFGGHREFSLIDHLQSWREAFRTTRVSVRVHRSVSRRFQRPWTGAVLEDSWDGDWLCLTFLTEECDWLTGWMLSFGTAVEILAPDSLREQVCARAQEIARHHLSPAVPTAR
ncbi:MAG: YafY family transcriptional regulator [Verrucomicrobiales bacterium]|nr:YafY family transcriptional regulator [Verrucomicrobiales bacterium]